MKQDLNAEKKKMSPAWAIVIIFAIVLIGFFPVFRIVRTQNEVFIELPRLSTAVRDSSGVSHSLDVDFVIIFDGGENLSQNDTKLLSVSIGKFLSDSAYENISSPAGTEYLKSGVRTCIYELFPQRDNPTVYISAYAGDFSFPPATEGMSRRESVFRGLFKNIK